MTAKLHLIKLCVGIEDVDHLAQVQQMRMVQQKTRGEEPRLRHITRMWPKRKEELLEGGSLYWVIKGVIRCRQHLQGLDEVVNSKGQPACGLVLDPEIIETENRRMRPFQGWRYLKPEDAPRDGASGNQGLSDLPQEMAQELRDLGLL